MFTRLSRHTDLQDIRASWLCRQKQRRGEAARLCRSRLSQAAIKIKKKALALLEECYRLHLPGLGSLKVDPDFDPLRATRVTKTC